MKRTDSNNNMQDLELIPGIEEPVVLKNVGKMVDTIFTSSPEKKKMKELSKQSLEPCQTGVATEQNLQKKHDTVINNMAKQYKSFLSQKKLPYSCPLFLHANRQGWNLCEILFNTLYPKWEEEYKKKTLDLTKVEKLINKKTNKRKEKFQDQLWQKKQQLEQFIDFYQKMDTSSQDFITAKNKQFSNQAQLKQFEDLISKSAVNRLLNNNKKKQNTELNITTNNLYLLANIASNFYDDVKSIFDISRREFYACFYSWVQNMHDDIISDFQWVNNEDKKAFFDNEIDNIQEDDGFGIDIEDIEMKQMERLEYIGKILLVVNSIAIHCDEIGEQRDVLKKRLKQLHEEEIGTEEEKRDTVQGQGKKKKKKKKTKTNNVSTINNISTVKLDEDKKEENLNIIHNPDGWKYAQEINSQVSRKNNNLNESKRNFSLNKKEKKNNEFHLFSVKPSKSKKRDEIINRIEDFNLRYEFGRTSLERANRLSREKGNNYYITHSKVKLENSLNKIQKYDKRKLEWEDTDKLKTILNDNIKPSRDVLNNAFQLDYETMIQKENNLNENFVNKNHFMEMSRIKQEDNFYKNAENSSIRTLTERDNKSVILDLYKNNQEEDKKSPGK